MQPGNIKTIFDFTKIQGLAILRSTFFRTPAGCKPAIQQSATLRYPFSPPRRDLTSEFGFNSGCWMFPK
jgi:hypothetical protein